MQHLLLSINEQITSSLNVNKFIYLQKFKNLLLHKNVKLKIKLFSIDCILLSDYFIQSVS